jgi:peptide/nickel transport system permease protein
LLHYLYTEIQRFQKRFRKVNLRYILRRLANFFLVTFLAITVNFLIPRLMPGDPIEQKLSGLMATSSGQSVDIDGMVRAYREKFGLDQPLWRQYLNYWNDLLHFELGYSLANYPETVSQSISAALPWSVGLVGTATLISFVIGSLLGGVLAWPRFPRWLRRLTPMLMVVSAVPYFLIGFLLIYFLAVLLRLFPAGGGYQFGRNVGFDLESLGNILHHAILPAASIIIAGIGSWALGMRGMVVSILGEDYVALARAKGLSERHIFFRYGLRNSLLPQTTALALALGYVVSGAILVETVFAYPGIGFKLYQAIQTKDYFVIQGIVLVLILAVALNLLIMDLIYPLLDPRITYQRS